MSDKPMTHYTSEQLSQLPVPPIDWDKLKGLSDQAIEAEIALDPDAAPLLDQAFFKTAELVQSSKVPKRRITMLVDEEVLAFFQADGVQGYQKRMHDVLKAYARHDLTRHA